MLSLGLLGSGSGFEFIGKWVRVWVYWEVGSGFGFIRKWINVGVWVYSCNRVYCIHVQGHDPITFSFRSFSFLIGWGVYCPII